MQKLEVIKRFKSMETASLLLIQETKKSAEDNIAIIKNIWPKGTGLAISANGGLRRASMLVEFRPVCAVFSYRK